PLAIFFSTFAHAQWREIEPYRKEFLTIGDYSDITAITATTSYAYFASSDGILRWDIINQRWIEPLSFDVRFAGAQAYRLAVTFDDEKLWVETDRGVFLYERILSYWEEVTTFPREEIRGEMVAPEHLHVPPDNYSYLPGGILLDFKGRRFDTGPVLRDNSGFLWMGIRGLGAARSEINGGRLELMPFGLLDRYVLSMELIDGRLVIGGRSDSPGRTGLTFLDPQTGTFSYIEQGVDYDLPATDILALGESADEYLAGGYDGLYIIDKESESVLEHHSRFSGLPNGQVNSILGYGDTILVGTNAGLAVISPDSTGVRELVSRALTYRSIYSLEPAYPTAKRRVQLGDNLRPRFVWVGAESGAYRLDVRDFSLKKLNDPELILESQVRKIKLVSGNLWLLADGGLVRVGVKTGEVESFPEFNYIGAGATLAVNSSHVAIGDNRGFTIFQYRGPSTDEKETPLHYRYTVEDGLASNTTTSLEFVGDFLWIGSDRGLTRFWWNDPSRTY
ncbi:MAG: hypothetical protein ACE5GA_11370, partial [Candidatus Zixiibacteriota bacterium]